MRAAPLAAVLVLDIGRRRQGIMRLALPFFMREVFFLGTAMSLLR